LKLDHAAKHRNFLPQVFLIKLGLGMCRFAIVGAGLLSVAGFVGAASAADLPASTYTKAPAVVAAPVYNWTGCYIGVEGGGNWGRAGTTAATSVSPRDVGLPTTPNYNLSGGLVGGTAGCNYQVSNWVFGFEGDASWTKKSGNTNEIAPFTTTTTNTLQEKWFDTVSGRVGYAWDRVLIFGTAGGAFAGTTYTDCNNTAPFVAGCLSDSQTRSGWVAGAGVEYAFWNNLSVKLEYLHADFGSKTYINTPVTVVTAPSTFFTFGSRSIRLTDDVVRVGLNYKFDFGSPVVAKY
jgi:outer membrane immunogenic protein